MKALVIVFIVMLALTALAMVGHVMYDIYAHKDEVGEQDAAMGEDASATEGSEI